MNPLRNEPLARRRPIPAKANLARIRSGEVAIVTKGFLDENHFMPRRISAWKLAGTFLFCFFSIVVLLIALIVYGQTSQMEKETASSRGSNTNTRPVLLELFTSEGCSSCPPADALLEKIDATQPVPGAQLIVLSEHVDYWDHDGWKDPNSSPSLTERQDAYVHALGLKTAYTPQFIIDGATEMRANEPQKANKAMEDAVSEPKIPVRISDVKIDAGNPAVLQAHIEAEGTSVKRNADVFVAVTLNRVESQVLHGENGGRHLTHVAVIEQLIKVGKLPKGKNFAENVQLKLKPGTDPKNIRIVAFVQEPGPGKVLGAALQRSAN